MAGHIKQRFTLALGRITNFIRSSGWDKLKNAVFDPVFNHFLQVMTDGNFINLTEDKLKLIDQIDIFYSGKESQLPVSKPFFIKLALNYLGDKLVEFNKLPSNMKQNLIHLWNNELEKHQNS